MTPLGFVPHLCHCEEPRRGDVAIPLGIRRLPRPMPMSSCATRLRGLLRRFGDLLLAMTTGGCGKRGLG